MADNQVPADNTGNTGSPAPDPSQPPAPKKKRRARKWLIGIGIVLLLLVLLIVLLPTITSTGPVRSFVVGKVNDSLNGKLEVADWSLGWISGVRVSGVKVYDEQARLVLSMESFKTDLSLINAAKGNLTLGDTLIEEPNLVQLEIDENGRTNYEKLLKSEPAQPAKPKKPKPTPQEPAELPQISGNLQINRLRGTIVAAGVSQPIHIEPSDISVKIPSINDPIANDVKLSMRVGDAAPGTIALVGTVDAVDANQIAVEKLVADQALSLTTIDLGALTPLLKMAAVPVELTGIANGNLALKASGITNADANGQIVVDKLTVAGEALNGDHFATSRLTIPVVVNAARSGDVTVLKIDKLGIEMPELTVNVTGQLPQEALQRLIDNTAPGADGQVVATVSVPNLAAIANQLPRTLQLVEGVSIDSGEFNSTTKLALAGDRATIDQAVDLRAAGKNNGKPITLQPVHIELAAAAIPNGKDIPDIRNLKLLLTSAFAKLQGGGESLAAVNLTGDYDLKKLQDEAGQFVDMGGVDLAGNGTLAVNTKGDVLAEAEPIAADVKVNVSNLRVVGIADKPFTPGNIALAASATMARGKETFIESIPTANVTLTSGDPASPTVDLAAEANGVQLANNAVQHFSLTKLNIPDLPKARRDYSAFLGALDEAGLDLIAGQLAASASGSYDGSTVTLDKPLAVSVRNLTIEKVDPQDPKQRSPLLKNETIDVAVLGKVTQSAEQLAAAFSQLSVTSSSNLFSVKKADGQDLAFTMTDAGAITGGGAIALGADLVRASELANAFSAPGQKPEPGTQLTSGRLDGTVMFASEAKPGTSVKANFDLTKLTIPKVFENEKVAIIANLSSPDEFKSLAATANVNSAFATVNLTDAAVQLQPAQPGATLAPLDMLRSAKLEVSAPDLPKLQALANAFAAAAPAPAPAPTEASADGEPVDEDAGKPIEIAKGAAVIKADVVRQGQATQVNVSDLRLSNLTLNRGKRSYAFDKDIALTLAAALESSADGAIQSVRATRLDGNLGVATLKMPQPITVTNLSAASPAANGSVELAGDIRKVNDLLEALRLKTGENYAGAFVITQAVSTQNDVITLNGAVNATDFRVLRGKEDKEVFAEKQVNLLNSVSLDTAAKNVTISDLSLKMQSSQAAELVAKGKLVDWETARKFENMKVDLGYDLEKIWEIVRPMLSKQQQEDLKTLKIAGKGKGTFTIAGSYPANVESYEAIKQLDVVGALAVPLFDYEGIHVEGLQLPVTLKKGILGLVYGDRPRGERLPSAAKFNGGELYLGGINVNLGQEIPRLNTPKKHQLIENATINPLLGKTLGKFVNPVFANSTRAEGLLSVSLEYCENLALGEAIKTPESGRTKVLFSLTQMDIANPVGGYILDALSLDKLGISANKGAADTFRGRIKDAVVTIENGRTTQDITFEIMDPKVAADVIATKKPVEPEVYPLRFQGDVDLSSLAQSLTFTVPANLLASWTHSDEIAKYLPAGLPLTMGGTTTAPKVVAGDILKKLAEGQVQYQLQKAIGGGDSGGSKTGEGGAGGILGDLLNQQKDEPKPDTGKAGDKKSDDKPKKKKAEADKTKSDAGTVEEKPDPVGDLLGQVIGQDKQQQPKDDADGKKKKKKDQNDE